MNTYTKQRAPSRQCRLYLVAAVLVLTPFVSADPGGKPLPKVAGMLEFHLQLNSLQPAAVTVTPGRYFIRVINGLVTGDITVQIEDAGKNKLTDRQVQRRSRRFSGYVDLRPGTYTVRVVGKPEWSSTITVTSGAGE